MSQPKWIATTHQQVADFLGVKRQTVKQWSAGDMPGEPGKYDLSAITKWLRKRDEENCQQRVSKISTLKDEKLREDIRNRKLKNDELEGKLILRDEVERYATQAFSTVKTRFDSIPDAIELELPREYMHLSQVVRRHIHLALTELADSWGDDPIPEE